MLVEKSNLLKRVRVGMIALVALVGFGTMAMKPAGPPSPFRYGVVENLSGTGYEVAEDVSNSTTYHCSSATDKICTIFSDSQLAIGQDVQITPGQIQSSGEFGL